MTAGMMPDTAIPPIPTAVKKKGEEDTTHTIMKRKTILGPEMVITPLGHQALA
jgi:hypothetical protein